MLTTGDLSTMANRTQTLLTPEGAQSWYVNDVSRLLDEVGLLRQQIQDAKDALAADGITEAPLPAMTLAWKAEASGIYKSKLYARAKDKINTVRRENADLKAQIEDTQKALTILQDAFSSAEASHQAAAKTAVEALEYLQARLTAEQDQNQSLKAEVARVNDALVACQTRCEQVIGIQREQYEEKKALALEALQTLMAQMEE